MTTVAAEILADDPVIFSPCQEVNYVDWEVNGGAPLGLLEDPRDGPTTRPFRAYTVSGRLNDTQYPAAPVGLGRHAYVAPFQPVSLDQNPIFRPYDGTGYTVEGWFYITDWMTGAKLFSSKADALDPGEIYLSETSLASRNTGQTSFQGFSFAPLPRNAWTHIVISVEADGNAVVYVNKAVWGSGQIFPVTSRTTRHGFAQGWGESAGVGTGFTHLAVYHTALSAVRVAAHYDAKDTAPTGNIAIMPERLDAGHIAKGFVARIDLGALSGAQLWDDLNPDFSNLEVLDENGTPLPFDLVVGDYAATSGELYARIYQVDPLRVTWLSVIAGSRTALPAATDPLGREACWQDYVVMVIASGGDLTNRAPGPVLTPVGSPTVVGGYMASGGLTASLTLSDWQSGVSVFFPDALSSGTTSTLVTGIANDGVYPSGAVVRAGDTTRMADLPSGFLSTNMWHHLVEVWDDSEFLHDAYVDGGAGIRYSSYGASASSFSANVPVGGRLNNVYIRYPTKMRTNTSDGHPLDVAALSRLEYLSWRLPNRFFAYATPAVPTFSLTPGPGAVTVALSEPWWDHEVRIAPASDPASTTTYSVPAGTATYKMKGLDPSTGYVVDTRAINPLGTSAWSATQSATTPSATYRDDFTRANSTSTPGTPNVGGPYTLRNGTSWGINSNQLYTAVSTAEAQITVPGEIDLDFQVKIKAVGTSPGLMFRWIDTSNFWLITFGTTTPGLYRRTAGAYTQFATFKTAAVNDVYRVVCRGRYITVLRNGRSIATQEDLWASQATATVGFRLNSDITSRLDDAILLPALEDPLTSDAPVLTTNTARDLDSFLYKGRDTKIADQGAVA